MCWKLLLCPKLSLSQGKGEREEEKKKACERISLKKEQMTEKGEGKAADSPLFIAALRKATKAESKLACQQ